MKRHKLKLKEDGEDYKFGSFIPDMADVNALIAVSTEFFNNFNFAEYRKGMRAVETNHHVFSCGFNRGCAWMMHKLQEKKEIWKDYEE